MKRCTATALACAVAALVPLGCSRAPSPAADGAPAAPAANRTSAAEPAPSATAPAFVLPGDLTARTDVAALRARYGSQNVREGEVPGAEGETFPGAILFPDDPQRRAYVYFGAGDAAQQVASVRVFDAGSRWTLDDGIAIGTPLSELVERNGEPIRFYGLEWDYGGTIIDWSGGALAPVKDAAVLRALQLGARDGAERYPIGDGEFASDDPAFPDLGRALMVAEIGITFVQPQAEPAP